MIRKSLGAALVALVGATALPSAPAQAAGPAITVTSPSCGTLKVTNTSTSRYVVILDDGSLGYQDAKSSDLLSGLPGGDYVWVAGPDGSEIDGAPRRVTVKPCGSAKRPVDGDQNGDGLADVLGIQAGTGNLYYYRMTATRLAGGVLAGTGWNNMVFMQQVNEIEGGGTPNYLIAVRNDGTVWRYTNNGAGKFSNGKQIGSGLKGYTNFTITGTNNPLSFGGHMLLASKGDQLQGFMLTANSLEDPITLADGWSATTKTIATRDFDGDVVGDLITIRADGTMWSYKVATDSATELLTQPVQVGHGWGAMQTVSSPGSLNGDKLSDLIARRSDGNLYKYINHGAGWNAAYQIGQNWNKIRLLA